MRSVYRRAAAALCLAPFLTVCASDRPAADRDAAAGARSAGAPHAEAPTQPGGSHADERARAGESPGAPLETPEPRMLRLLGPLVVPDTTGAERALLDFERDSELVRGWREQDGANMARPEQQGDYLVTETKHYFIALSPLPDGWLGIAVTPSHPEWRRVGHEYWRVHPLDRRIERFRYPSRTAGFVAASGPVVFALDTSDDGVYRYAFPD